MTPPGSQEAAVIQSYLDCILDLPWEASTPNDFDVAQAVEILDREHYGLEKVKDRIIEYIAVMKRTNSLRSPILCLVGPPGVGKTSVARSIANATGRKFVRISLGGMHDEAEIRGHRKTYVGAMPGRIIAGLRQVQSKNPVFLLDEIDKLSRDVKGDPASALLEALDPEQNSTFTDTYVEIPFNLSDVMFITTANSTSTIPPALLDRLEVIELNGYMPTEKVEIAKRHLIPKQLAANGITDDNIVFTDDVLLAIIDGYTRETGVRQLERSIASLCRKATKALVLGESETLELTVRSLSELLGRQVHVFDVMDDLESTGVVNGLAWTGVGGDTLSIETNKAVGNGHMELTGNLGDVMKESAKTAIGFLKSNAENFGLSDIDWSKLDLHIHVPEGAVPKDGPSAGIALATCIISALSGKPVSRRIAMTGEITLTGRVLPIGGLREKLLAANRAKISRVIIPMENEADLSEIPKEILESLTVTTASEYKDVYKAVFVG
jgi:ATP-dependent Lon protease